MTDTHIAAMRTAAEDIRQRAKDGQPITVSTDAAVALAKWLDAQACEANWRLDATRTTFASSFADAYNAGLDDEDRGTGCCARDGIDCPSCMTGRCHECSECVHYDDSACDDEDGFYDDNEEDD